MDRAAVEILAPAGNILSARAALSSGADAIYLGYSNFSARAAAENFDDEKLKEIICEAHLLGAKVYVAMNTLVKDCETEGFVGTLLKVWSIGADAIILQDIFLGKAIKEAYPEIVLHLSTQAGVCNENGAKLAKRCGFSRVILARETKFEDIEKITKIIETEAFVHGALCSSFSGQCYFSSFVGGLSGNRGRCKQPCRKKYCYDHAKKSGVCVRAKENLKGVAQKTAESGELKYALSLSDLCLGDAALKLAEIGVKSFKVEGRMRRKEYVAAATQYYDKIFKGAGEKDKSGALSDLKRAYNRGNYTQGLATEQDRRLLSPFVQGHIGEKIGVVKVVDGKYFVETRETFSFGDAYKILRDKREVGGATFLGKAVFEKFGSMKAQGIYIASKERLKNGDGVFVTTDEKSLSRVLSMQHKRDLFVDIVMNSGKFGLAKCGDITVKTAEKLCEAENRALTIEEIEQCFKKTDGLPFEIHFSKIETNNAFLPKSALNAFRRKFFAEIVRAYVGESRHVQDFSKFFSFHKERENCVLNNDEEQPENNVEKQIERQNKKVGAAVIARKFTGKESGVAFAIGKPNDYSKFLRDPQGALCELFGEFLKNDSVKKYVYYPAYATEKTERAIAEAVENADKIGVYAENYSAAAFCEELGTKFIFGTGANITNCVSVSELLKNKRLEALCVSKEIDRAEQEKIIKYVVNHSETITPLALCCGDIKTMDLCYCPFGKTCGDCDKRDDYTLTDENGRVFPVRRYKDGNGECRFEVFNCASLVGRSFCDAVPLIDCSCSGNVAKVLSIADDENKQKAAFENYTFGHVKNSVL